MTRSGWVAGDIIASQDDPNRGKWLTVWGSAYRSPVLHANRAAAVASDLRGESVAQVTEYPMPGASVGYCYRIAPGTLGKRAESQREITEVDGKFYGPVVLCSACGYLSPATFSAPVSCPACDGAPVMGEVALTSAEYVAACKAWDARIAAQEQRYADQRGHDVAWMTAAERDALDAAEHSLARKLADDMNLTEAIPGIDY